MIDIDRSVLERHEMMTSTALLFPNWINAVAVLRTFCYQTDGWVVDNDGCHLTIRPKYPAIVDLFPLEYIPMIDCILNKLGDDYIPDMSKFMRHKISDELKYAVLCEIRNKEYEIISRGGRSFKDEMKFRLGVYYA